MPTIDDLARGHENMARLLLVLDSHLSRSLSGEEPDVRLMQGIADYVIDYLERRHNPLEELVLVRLARRDRAFRSVFEAHTHELRELRVTMARFSGLLAASCVDPEYDRDKLSRAGRAFVTGVRRRIVLEDSERLPGAACVLDAEDWRAIEATARVRRVRSDPWTDERCSAAFQELVTAAGCNCEYSS